MEGAKIKLLKKTLIKEGAIALAIIVGLGGGSYFLVGSEEEATRDRDAASAAVNGTQAQIDTIRRQIEESGRSAEVVAKINEEKENLDFEFDKNAVQPVLAKLNAQHRLVSLKSEVQKPVDFPVSALQSIGMTAEQSELKLTFGAMSDTHSFSLLAAMKSNFPGFVKIKNFKITRKAPMDVSTLRQISAGSVPELISAEATLIWAGLKKKTPEEKAALTGQEIQP